MKNLFKLLRDAYRREKTIEEIKNRYVGCFSSYNERDELLLIANDPTGKHIREYVRHFPMEEASQLALFDHPKGLELLKILARSQQLDTSVQLKIFELDDAIAEDIFCTYCNSGWPVADEAQVKLLEKPAAWKMFNVCLLCKYWAPSAQLALLEKEDAGRWIKAILDYDRQLDPATVVEMLKRRDLDDLIPQALRKVYINPDLWAAMMQREDAAQLAEYLIIYLNRFKDIPYGYQFDITKLENRECLFLYLLGERYWLSEACQSWLFDNLQEAFLRYYLETGNTLSDEVQVKILNLEQAVPMLRRYIKYGGLLCEEVQMSLTKTPTEDCEDLISRYIKNKGLLVQKAEMALIQNYPNAGEYLETYIGFHHALSPEAQVAMLELPNGEALVEAYAKQFALDEDAYEVAIKKGWM